MRASRSRSKNTSSQKALSQPIPVRISAYSSSNHSEPKSYLELIQEHLRKYEQTQGNEEQRTNYNLYEDLKIIVVIATDETQSRLGTLFWDALNRQHLNNRSGQSLRSRYREFLKYLQKDDFNTIINHLNEKGLKGYLVFESIDNQKTLKGISDLETGQQQTQTVIPKNIRIKEEQREQKVLGRSGYKPSARKGVRMEYSYGQQGNVYAFINEVYLNTPQNQTRKEEELARLIRNYKNRKQNIDSLNFLGKSEVVDKIAESNLDKQEVIHFIEQAHKVFLIPPRQIVDILDQVDGSFQAFLQIALNNQTTLNNQYDDHLIKKVKRKR